METEPKGKGRIISAVVLPECVFIWYGVPLASTGNVHCSPAFRQHREKDRQNKAGVDAFEEAGSEGPQGGSVASIATPCRTGAGVQGSWYSLM